jgi:hypothetical protein
LNGQPNPVRRFGDHHETRIVHLCRRLRLPRNHTRAVGHASSQQTDVVLQASRQGAFTCITAQGSDTSVEVRPSRATSTSVSGISSVSMMTRWRSSRRASARRRSRSKRSKLSSGRVKRRATALENGPKRRPTGNGKPSTYLDGVGVLRCHRCLSRVPRCNCSKQFWCSWCHLTDPRLFRKTQPRCCKRCLATGRTPRR